ncbi:SCO family protein [Candidatus Protofrankia datiscae]|uniref:SCO family protein n=1 Tax=Candidatus Protofrankia datiscae TaxID=2716812 RepID=UPI0001C534AF|nr:SCO family protein [Candidatus Protofrankia datiscae]
MALLCLAGSAGCATSEPTHPADGPPVRSSAAVATATGGWHGTVPKVSRSRPSFTLTDTAGHSFDFARQTAGRATLLFFGYTNCPDVCPTTMADIAAAKRLARNDAGSALTVVFVTTDPGRDSAEALRRWLDQFDSSFTGSPAHRLTGSPARRRRSTPRNRPWAYRSRRRSRRPAASTTWRTRPRSPPTASTTSNTFFISPVPRLPTTRPICRGW